MPTRRPYLGPSVAGLCALFVLVILLPQGWKGWAPAFLQNATFHFGLDLAGGTQLDFRISEQEIEDQYNRLTYEIESLERAGASASTIAELQEQQQIVEEQRSNLIEAIRTVIERRINALGVSEAVITPSIVGGEKHLLIECPGVVDTQECIAVVGKTIQLEFKEEFMESDAIYTQQVRDRVAQAGRRMTKSGATLAMLGQDLGDELGMVFWEQRTFFRGNLPKGLEDALKAPAGKLLEREGSIAAEIQQEDGSIEEEEIPGIFLTEVLTPRFQTGRTLQDAPTAFQTLERQEQGLRYTTFSQKPLDVSVPLQVGEALRAMKPGELRAVTLDDGSSEIIFLRSFLKGGEEVEASHILVAYNGASGAGYSVTRTKEAALSKAKEIKARLDAGANFAQLARKESDGPSAKDGGSLGVFRRGTMAPAFEATAFGLSEGAISDPVETQFGYHIIRVDRGKTLGPDLVSYDELAITGTNASVRAQELIGRLQSGNVRALEDAVTLRTLFFSLRPTGWKDTTLDGRHFRTASVTLDPVTNVPVVQIVFDAEGGKMFQELTKRNVNKRIAIFVGGELVSAPVVQQEIIGGNAIITGSENFEEARLLALDLNTGAIPAPIHLVGQYTVEATLGAAALATSLKAALLGTVVLMIFMILVYRLLGIVANLALFVYAVLLAAILRLPLFLFSGDSIVLTLAGMAGIILSIGMAIDANVLVFERMREELRKGKLLKTAVETSFQHAWPAIRDGNFSTLITCAILFLIGTSIVRGFAITLGMGILLSMFTAITVTRWMLRKIITLSVAQNLWLFCGVRPREGLEP